MNKIEFFNISTGECKEASIGFSWTTLFFGPLPMLFRGKLGWTLGYCLMYLIFGELFTIVFPFFYNKLYIRSLLNNRYLPLHKYECDYLVNKGYIEKYKMNVLRSNRDIYEKRK